jgi:hypothetical protein
VFCGAERVRRNVCRTVRRVRFAQRDTSEIVSVFRSSQGSSLLDEARRFHGVRLDFLREATLSNRRTERTRRGGVVSAEDGERTRRRATVRLPRSERERRPTTSVDEENPKGGQGATLRHAGDRPTGGGDTGTSAARYATRQGDTGTLRKGERQHGEQTISGDAGATISGERKAWKHKRVR